MKLTKRKIVRSLLALAGVVVLFFAYLAVTPVNVSKLKARAKASTGWTHEYPSGQTTYELSNGKLVTFIEEEKGLGLQVDYPALGRWGNYFLIDNSDSGFVDVALCSQPPGMHESLTFYANRETGQGRLFLPLWQIRYRLTTMF